MKYVALLRGIVPMNPNMRNAKLRGVLEDLGFTHVKSVISSGNLVFESPQTDSQKIETTLEAAWQEKLGFSSTSIVRSLKELQDLVAAVPFASLTHSKETSLNVTFLKHAAAADSPRPEGLGYTVKLVRPREVCTVINTTAVKTPNYMTKAEKIYGKEITTRTWKTVERIIAALS
jgi:uncharacterized protein (DUF1697 family)